MRIAIIASSYSASDGGAHAFEQSIINSATQSASKHTFLFFDIKGNLLLERSDSSLNRQPGTETPPAKSGLTPSKHKNRSNLAKIAKKTCRYIFGPILPSKAKAESQVSLDQRLHEHKIEFVWFSYPACCDISIPYALTIWDLAHRSTPFFPEISLSGWDWTSREAFYHRYIPRASLVITGTQAGKDEIAKYYGIADENIVVNPLPVPLDVIKAAVTIKSAPAALESSIRSDNDQPYFFYPAQFWPHKNHVNLLLALQIIRQQYAIDVSLVLTGADKGNLAYIKATIAQLGLEQSVKLFGFVSRYEIIHLYRNAVALVYPSLIGPDNLPPLEAMALGCPVLSGALSGSKEQFGDAALLFDPTNPLHIADCMLTIYRDPGLRVRLINNAYQLASIRSVDSYMAIMNSFFDRFSAIRRCWGLTYEHS